MKTSALTFLLVALLLALLSLTAAAQTHSKAAVAEIDAYTKTVSAEVKRHSKSALIFADVSDYRKAGPEKWRAFSSKAEFDRYTKKNEVYTVADGWKVDGKLVDSSIEYSSPSGDWSQVVESFFRADGTLAKVTSEMRTFHQECVIRQRLYFDGTGKMLKKTIAYSDLNTGKKKGPCGMVDDRKVDYYKTTAKLPYAKLIQ